MSLWIERAISAVKEYAQLLVDTGLSVGISGEVDTGAGSDNINYKCVMIAHYW